METSTTAFHKNFTKIQKGLHDFHVLSVPHTYCPVSMKITDPDCTLITSELHKVYYKEYFIIDLPTLEFKN